MKATKAVAFYVAAAGLIFGGGCSAQPETMEGLVKKDEAWKVPIVAKQPNENKPTQVLGSYPELSPDTLARPLKKNQGSRLPFSQFLAAASKATKRPSSTVPDHILQWLSQRQKSMTSSSPQPPSETEAKKIDPQPHFGVGLLGRNEQTQPVAVTKDMSGQEKKEGRTSTMKPRLLIQRPSYNPQLALASSTKPENEVAEEDETKVTLNPRVAAIIMDDFMERQKDKLSVAGLVIGLTFVAAFIAIAIGLVGHGLVKRCRIGPPSSSGDSGFSGRSSRNSWMRSPGDEDQTPPELRPGSQSGHPGYSNNNRRRSSGRTRHIPGTLPGHSGTPFFNGKLILHDPPGLNTNGASRGTSRPTGCNLLAMQSNGSGSCYPGAGGGFTLTSPPSKLGAIPKKMPSKAAQVTDILVSPKYEEAGGDTTEEEDSDDTVYECPGLAATKGTALEVRNPFFLEDCGLHQSAPSSGRLANKKPISQYTDLFHHQEIASLN